MKHLFCLYLLLRLKNFWRIFIKLGLFRILFLLLLLTGVTGILIQISTPYIPAVLFAFVLWAYHNYRNDKEWLNHQIPHLHLLLMCEYLLISIPFLLIEILKEEWIALPGILLLSIMIPFFKTLNFRFKPIPMYFFYRGSYEYIRMFRQHIWIYVLLLFLSVMGGLHENLRMVKACIVIWGILQAGGYILPVEPIYLLHYRNFHNLLLQQSKGIAQNTFLTLCPFIGCFFLCDNPGDQVVFLLATYPAMMVYILGVSMLRFSYRSTIAIFLLQTLLLLPFYLGTFFSIYLSIPALIMTGLSVWNTYCNLKKNIYARDT